MTVYSTKNKTRIDPPVFEQGKWVIKLKDGNGKQTGSISYTRHTEAMDMFFNLSKEENGKN